MMTEDDNRKYMARCLQLAALGRGHVSPNPMVGAVVVWRGQVIGEGYHRRCGEAHAEVNAIASVKDQSLLAESTIYVSLEPCSHYGKTPPCSKLIIEKRIPRVVVGIQDPFAAVAGRGIQMLREAGVDVTVGVMEEACRALNRTFLTAQEKQRPYVILKWAQSTDRYLDVHRTADDGQLPARISDSVNQTAVHKLRAEVDAILVGTRTALLDRPSLTVRRWKGRSPLRIVLDRKLTLPTDMPLFDGAVSTLVVTESEPPTTPLPNVSYLTLPFDESMLPSLLAHLAKERKVQSLLVEGGAKTIARFLGADLWDEARVETGPQLLGAGIPAPPLPVGMTTTLKCGHSVVTTVHHN